jgi:cysteinyl-tRNA synthetase
MKLYNTLNRTIEDVIAQQTPVITVYTCGPTVYDYPHIGNWFTFIRYDLLIRTLKASGLEPTWVMNITDVGHLTSDADEGEDKLEKGAKREGKSAYEVAQFYGDYFIEGLNRLNFTKPSFLPKATEHIAEQVALIETLEQKGFTSNIDDGGYYDTAKFPSYADFGKLDLDEQQAGARVALNPQKRNPTDFALWKFSPKDSTRDMEWDSPWGKGFPGWHIECSAMGITYLGETIDIHSGGIDHVPVHHTNEIAQSEAATGKPCASYWMHTNHVLVENEKISKSLGNGITLEDIESRGFSLEAFRLHVLESHYQSQSKFSWESLEAAQHRLQRFQAWADRQFQIQQGNDSGKALIDFSVMHSELLSDLQNNLDTPAMLASLEKIITRTEAELLSASSIADFVSLLKIVDQLLGTTLAKRHDISQAQELLIAEREQVRSTNDWMKSDELRDKLTEQGIGLRDTDNGAIWYRM